MKKALALIWVASIFALEKLPETVLHISSDQSDQDKIEFQVGASAIVAVGTSLDGRIYWTDVCQRPFQVGAVATVARVGEIASVITTNGSYGVQSDELVDRYRADQLFWRKWQATVKSYSTIQKIFSQQLVRDIKDAKSSMSDEERISFTLLEGNAHYLLNQTDEDPRRMILTFLGYEVSAYTVCSQAASRRAP